MGYCQWPGEHDGCSGLGVSRYSIGGGGWLDGWMDGWIDGWMDGWIDGWMDG